MVVSAGPQRDEMHAAQASGRQDAGFIASRFGRFMANYEKGYNCPSPVISLDMRGIDALLKAPEARSRWKTGAQDRSIAAGISVGCGSSPRTCCLGRSSSAVCTCLEVCTQASCGCWSLSLCRDAN